MGWTVFTRTLEEDEVVTPKHIEELWAALDERLRAVFDEGSKVEVANAPQEYLTAAVEGNYRIVAANPQTDQILAELLNRTAIRYAVKPESEDFYVPITPANLGVSPLAFAALDLGYSASEASAIATALRSTTFQLRSAHGANIMRRALQLMNNPVVELRLDAGRETNFASGTDTTKQKSAVNESYATAKSNFLSASESDQNLLNCQVTASRQVGCNYSISGQRFVSVIKLHSTWARGYKLFFQCKSLDNVNWQDSKLLIDADGEEEEVDLNDPNAVHVTEIYDQSEEVDPGLEIPITIELDVYGDPEALDDWPAPTRNGCNGETVTESRVSGITTISGVGFGTLPFFIGEMAFDYGPDPD